MHSRVFHVFAEWDEDEKVWVASSDDVPGLATGADTIEALIAKLRVLVPELLEVNGLLTPDGDVEVPLALQANYEERIRGHA